MKRRREGDRRYKLFGVRIILRRRDSDRRYEFLVLRVILRRREGEGERALKKTIAYLITASIVR